MPHRKNAKGDIGGLKRFSDTYDMDNVYLSEEGWVYRHFKNSEKTLWWDEILVAGQVKPGMVIHSIENVNVVPTNPSKLGTEGSPTFETGDNHNDIDYSDHERAADKITEYTDDASTEALNVRVDFQETAWSSINVESPEYLKPDETQVPIGWSGVSSPSDEATYGDQPPYVGEKYQSINHNTIIPETLPEPYDGATSPQSDAKVIVGEFDANTGPMVADEDYIADPDGPADAFGGGASGATGPITGDPTPPDAGDDDGPNSNPIPV